MVDNVERRSFFGLLAALPLAAVGLVKGAGYASGGYVEGFSEIELWPGRPETLRVPVSVTIDDMPLNRRGELIAAFRLENCGAGVVLHVEGVGDPLIAQQMADHDIFEEQDGRA